MIKRVEKEQKIGSN